MHIYNPITGSLNAVTSATNVWHSPAYNDRQDSITIYSRGDKQDRAILFYASAEDAQRELSEIAQALFDRAAVYTAQYNVPKRTRRPDRQYKAFQESPENIIEGRE